MPLTRAGGLARALCIAAMGCGRVGYVSVDAGLLDDAPRDRAVDQGGDALEDGAERDGDALDAPPNDGPPVDVADAPDTGEDAGPAPPPGSYRSAVRFGGSQDDVGASVAIDPAGNILLTGAFVGRVDFGGVELLAFGNSDVFVASFAPDGVLRWARRYGLSGPDTGYAVASDPDGNVLVTGIVDGPVDLGGGPLDGGGFLTAFVLSLGPDGAFRWQRGYSGTGTASCRGQAVATDASGNVFVAGAFETVVDFGDGEPVGAVGPDVFVVSLTPAGGFRWKRTYGGNIFDAAHGLVTDPMGNVTVTGYFGDHFGGVDFGGGPLGDGGSVDVFVVGLDSDGGHRWSRSLGGAGDDRSFGISADLEGNVVVTGYYTGTASLGGAEVTAAGARDIFVAAFAADGVFRWQRSFGGVGADRGNAVAMDSTGNVLVSGELSETADFGGGPLTSGGGTDIFVVGLDAEGDYRWQRRYGVGLDDAGLGITADGEGHALVTGHFGGAVDFGGLDALLSAGNEDVFLLALE